MLYYFQLDILRWTDAHWADVHLSFQGNFTLNGTEGTRHGENLSI